MNHEKFDLLIGHDHLAIFPKVINKSIMNRAIVFERSTQEMVIHGRLK